MSSKLNRWWDCFLWVVLPQQLFAKLKDRCETCKGARGGMRGNENVVTINGKNSLVCDYCLFEKHFKLSSLL